MKAYLEEVSNRSHKAKHIAVTLEIYKDQSVSGKGYSEPWSQQGFFVSFKNIRKGSPRIRDLFQDLKVLSFKDSNHSRAEIKLSDDAHGGSYIMVDIWRPTWGPNDEFDKQKTKAADTMKKALSIVREWIKDNNIEVTSETSH